MASRKHERPESTADSFGFPQSLTLPSGLASCRRRRLVRHHDLHAALPSIARRQDAQARINTLLMQIDRVGDAGEHRLRVRLEANRLAVRRCEHDQFAKIAVRSNDQPAALLGLDRPALPGVVPAHWNIREKMVQMDVGETLLMLVPGESRRGARRQGIDEPPLLARFDLDTRTIAAKRRNLKIGMIAQTKRQCLGSDVLDRGFNVQRIAVNEPVGATQAKIARP